MSRLARVRNNLAAVPVLCVIAQPHRFRSQQSWREETRYEVSRGTEGRNAEAFVPALDTRKSCRTSLLLIRPIDTIKILHFWKNLNPSTSVPHFRHEGCFRCVETSRSGDNR